MDTAKLHGMIARGNMSALQHSISNLLPAASRKQGSW
eukprot:CAMPEP_0174945170 /NCGR_PEP_ID=MMETSP1355-20121228/80865_1 /TAXON_ID=464990 /ORGANISM="Hemiselmis tepida, Strain CCMP443" /LENGTH=36 /DNA_ID= /DNA_START= /DNA_END= /DNA_ORIENTATION=